METINMAVLTKKIYDSGLSLFDLKTLNDILGVKKESTSFGVINRLIKSKVLVKIEKNKYLLQNGKADDFSLANFLYSPSYISFETALNIYGILSQFPYEITSCTSRKTKQKTYEEKLFSYTHIKKELFWGYEKKENFLIALPEKALLDQLYLAGKGLKGLSLDEYDFSFINLKKLKNYLNKYPKTRQFKKITALLGEYVKL